MSFPGPSELRPQPPSLGQAAGLVNEALAHRAELAAIELAEARRHAQTSALLLGVAGLFTLLAGFAFTLVLAGLVWESPHRAWWLAGLCAAYCAGGVVAVMTLGSRLRKWQPFAESRNQFEHDRQCLARLAQSMTA